MARSKITLYVDVVSPFAYEAYWLLRHEAVFRDVEVTYVPILLGGLLKMCGNTAPVEIKNKDKWIAKERLRWAAGFQIPMQEAAPPNFPPLTLYTMRALCALNARDQPRQPRLTAVLDRLFHEFWVNHQSIEKPAVFQPILKSVLGEEEAEITLAAAATTGKQALHSNTDKAFADGAFGLPWMVCTTKEGSTEGFWGVDHLGQVVQFLGLEKPASGGWKGVL